MEEIHDIEIVRRYFLQEDDSDYLCKLARLVNGIGLQLSISWAR